MADDRRVMYDGFNKKSGHSAKWVQTVKEFLNQAFAGGRRVAMCPYTICQNYRFLNQDEVQVHNTGRHRLNTAQQPHTRVRDNGRRQCRAERH
jgi:hypothetical protein